MARRRRYRKPTVLPPWVHEANGPKRPVEKSRYDFNDVADEWEDLGASPEFGDDWNRVVSPSEWKTEADRVARRALERQAREVQP